MKYISTYKLFESYFEDRLSEISNCFVSVQDITNVKISNSKNDFYGQDDFFAVNSPMGNVNVSIGLHHIVNPKQSSETSWGVKYKGVINGVLISEEIAKSISCCIGMGFKIKLAQVSWVNAGEWKLVNPDKEGTGPGLLSKIFQEGGIIGPSDMINLKVSKARYSTEILPDFIIDKGDKLRHVKIVFY